MILIRDRFIPREEISNLLWNMDSEISTHSLSMWLKSKTDNEFVVVPRWFVCITVSFFEIQATEHGDRLSHLGEMLRDLSAIKSYL